MSSTVNMLAAAGVGFGTEIGEEAEGPSLWIGRGVSNIGGGQRQLATVSQEWQDFKADLLWS